MRAPALLLCLAACRSAPPPPSTVEASTSSVPPSAAPLPPPAPTESGAFWQPASGERVVPILRADAPNMHYAALDPATCEAELTRRALPFVRGEPTPSVLAPVRLRGPLSGGVTFHSQLPPAQREHAAMEIFDCRLVLALDDFSKLLASRGIVEAIHLSAYRPRAQRGCTPKYDGLQHCGGLAVDIASFKRKDGTTLSVEHDFHGHIGWSTCTRHPAPNELWSLVCDAADRGLFNVILSPNYNAEHFNHLHMEVTPNAGWMMVP